MSYALDALDAIRDVVRNEAARVRKAGDMTDEVALAFDNIERVLNQGLRPDEDMQHSIIVEVHATNVSEANKAFDIAAARLRDGETGRVHAKQSRFMIGRGPALVIRG